MDWMILLLIAGGFVLLIYGAELLVRGASRLAAAVGISPLVIGLTVVAFGTSAPELAINLQAAFNGNTELALGNVVGSSIFNILVILGLAALITPLVVHQQLIRLDVPLMIGVSVLTWLMSLDGNLGRLDGLILFSGLVAYIGFSIYKSKTESQAVQDEYSSEYASKETHGWKATLRNLGMLVAGLALLVLGSNWLVEGATALARAAGVSDLLIGLTIVAIGTSLPEVATSVVAALKKERDIAVGNAVGSNLFNIMAVLGLTGLISPNGIAVSQTALYFDIPVMIAVAVAALPVFFTTAGTISRLDGGLFMLYYFIYTAYLIFDALDQQDSRALLTNVLFWVVLPLTILILGVALFNEFRARARQKA